MGTVNPRSGDVIAIKKALLALPEFGTFPDERWDGERPVPISEAEEKKKSIIAEMISLAGYPTEAIRQAIRELAETQGDMPLNLYAFNRIVFNVPDTEPDPSNRLERAALMGNLLWPLRLGTEPGTFLLAELPPLMTGAWPDGFEDFRALEKRFDRRYPVTKGTTSEYMASSPK